MRGPLFYAKILLFGEYGIIKDSKGLAIPYNSYQGALKMSEQPTELAKSSNQKLKSYLIYLFVCVQKDVLGLYTPQCRRKTCTQTLPSPLSRWVNDENCAQSPYCDEEMLMLKTCIFVVK